MPMRLERRMSMCQKFDIDRYEIKVRMRKLYRCDTVCLLKNGCRGHGTFFPSINVSSVIRKSSDLRTSFHYSKMWLQRNINLMSNQQEQVLSSLPLLYLLRRYLPRCQFTICCLLRVKHNMQIYIHFNILILN